MTIKKLTFCILCSMNAANLATEEDFNNENSSNSEVEENVLINKNNWNTRKWGNLYFLFPHLSIPNLWFKIIDECCSFRGKTVESWKRILNFILSGVIEYKYMFHKYCGINVRLNLNNFEIFGNSLSFFSLETSLEWIYGRKGKHIFSGSFSPLGFAIVQEDNGSCAEDFCKKCLTLGGVLLKYEYDKRFYLNCGKIKITWYNWKDIGRDDLWTFIGYNLASIEFGLNIIGVNDWIKKEKKNIKI